MPADRPLTPRQARFVELYLLSLNATEAYREAYGASQSVAESSGPRLLGNVRVAAAVTAAQQARSERVKIKQDDVLRELAILLRSDVRDFDVDPFTGELTLAVGADDSAWRAVSSVKHRTITSGRPGEERTTREIEFKLWDKPAAIKMAGQHLAMFTEKHEVDLKGAGVLAVPVPITDIQWGAVAAASQAALVAHPPRADLAVVK